MSCISRMKGHSFKNLTLMILLASIMVLCCDNAWAHRVTIFALVEGDTVKTISKFSGGKRVKKGEVVVMDLQGHTLLKGMTNEEGEFSFKIPKREALKVVLKAGMGHRAEWTIPTEEITGSPNETKDMAPEQIQNPSEGRKDSSESYALKTVASDEIEAAVEKALDRRLQPIVTMLERIHEPKTSLKDILGGIGYIVGLVGIAAYIQSVRKKPTRKGS